MPKNLAELANALKNLINQNHLHEGDGPVNLTPLIDALDIHIKYKNLPSGLHGLARRETIEAPSTILLNIRDNRTRHNTTRGHELSHLLFHTGQPEHYCFNGQHYDSIEFEADFGAAYLLVPLSILIGKIRDGWNFEQVAGYLEVTPKLVYKRYEVALELGEL